MSPILEDRIYFYTNFTLFHIPVYLYNGLLSVNILHHALFLNNLRSLSIQIQTADDNEIVTRIDELNFEIIPINSNKEIIFAINNSNPIDVNFLISKLSFFFFLKYF